MTADEVFGKVRSLAPESILVTLSGGNPALQPLGGLLDLGHREGYEFALETQGSVARPWFASLDYLTLSPKGPSSGMETCWDRLDRCVAFSDTVRTSLKVVIFDEPDYAYARTVHARYPHVPFYLQVGNAEVSNRASGTSAAFDLDAVLSRMRWLVDRVAADRWTRATVLPQLHTLLWGNTRGL
jgi:7-carboxy-7-deazaguanine synthase